MRKKINLSCVLFIIILIFSNFNCKTMQLNQTAEIIGKNKKESMFTGGAGANGTIVSSNIKSPPLPAGMVNLGFQQRFGITTKIELQLKIRSDLAMGGIYQNFLFENHNAFYFIPKFNVYSNKKTYISLLPHLGLSLSIMNTSRIGFLIPSTSLTTGIEPQIGFSFIASHNFSKKLYYGVIINFKEDFTKFYFEDSKPFFDMDLSFSVGWEDKQKVISRNEFTFFTNFDLYLKKQLVPVYEDSSLQKIVETKTYYFPNLSFFTFGLCYSISIGKVY